MLLGMLFMLFDHSLVEEKFSLLWGDSSTNPVLNIKLSDWRDPTADQFYDKNAHYMPLVQSLSDITGACS